MRSRSTSFYLAVTAFAIAATLAGCNEKKPATPATTSEAPKLGIKPFGSDDPNFKPDYSKLQPDIAKVFQYIDDHIDEHVENLQKWMRQPSISNSGEGIPETAEMVKGFFDKLGCQTTRVYDVGITEYGTPGNPVVYGKCDEGAPKTVAIYWQYDTMPVTQPENWVAPPFEARIVDGSTAAVSQASRVVIGRGAVNSKGGEMAELNALMSIKAVMGKLPVNIIWIAEGDEERMDIGLRKFVQDHSDLLKEADALYAGGPSEGCVYVELTTSGKSWGRGPVQSDIHGANKRSVDSPAWRHIKMLSSLVSDDGNTPKIKGFFDGREPWTPEQLAAMKAQSSHNNLEIMAKNLGVARFISDDPLTQMEQARGTSFNLDGIWGGNMYAGGAGAILPNKVTSKHNFRYVPKMNGLEIVKDLRAQLDANGYKDVEMKLIGDVPWSRGSNTHNDISEAHRKANQLLASVGLGRPMREDGTSGPQDSGLVASSSKHPLFPISDAPTDNNYEDNDAGAPTGGYWPAYLFADGEAGQKVGTVSLPMGIGSYTGGGEGGRAHAANEYYTVEAKNKFGGMANAEKNIVATMFSYAQITTVPIRPKGTTPKQ
jgi:acetylornithine deacetylase/succinyl-diaminopimelate desuccinylase-like protein